MLIRHPDDIAPSEITPRELYLDRRRFLALGAAGALLSADALAALSAKKSLYSTAEKVNPLKDLWKVIREAVTIKRNLNRNAYGLLAPGVSGGAAVSTISLR